MTMHTLQTPDISSFTLPHGTPAAARTVLKLLHKLHHGSLTITLPDGTSQRFGAQAGLGGVAVVALHVLDALGRAPVARGRALAARERGEISREPRQDRLLGNQRGRASRGLSRHDGQA